MIHLPVHRAKSPAVLRAAAPGLPGPFGNWAWGSDDDEAAAFVAAHSVGWSGRTFATTGTARSRSSAA